MWTLLLFALLGQPASEPFADIAIYNGAWTITATHTLAGAGKTDSLVNQCARVSAYYSCEQAVNGKSMALVVFVPGDAPGAYHTQIVLPNGYSTGRGDLLIVGDHWTFSSKDTEDAKTTWYRTENTFTGRDKIHFEQYQSADGKTWELKNSGDDLRRQKHP